MKMELQLYATDHSTKELQLPATDPSIQNTNLKASVDLEEFYLWKYQGSS